MIELRPSLAGLGLRPARADDTGFAWELYETAMRARTEALFAWDAAAQRRIIESEIAGGEAAMILWRDDRVGWFRLAEMADRLFLHQVYLVEPCRRLGIGSALIRAIQAEAGRLHRRVELSVLHSNPDARRLYDRLGFAETRANDVRTYMRWTPA